MSTKTFHIGDLLSVITGRLVSPRHMDGVYEVCDFMTGESNFTHQLPRVSKECGPGIVKQHPKLGEINADAVTPENWQAWLDDKVRRYGETFEIRPLSADEHERIDPLSELAEMVHPDHIVVVNAAQEDGNG